MPAVRHFGSTVAHSPSNEAAYAEQAALIVPLHQSRRPAFFVSRKRKSVEQTIKRHVLLTKPDGRQTRVDHLLVLFRDAVHADQVQEGAGCIQAPVRRPALEGRSRLPP